MKICYNGEPIELFYCTCEIKGDGLKIKGEACKKTRLKNDDYFNDYKAIEEEALMYLVKNAVDNKKCDNNLKKIISIRQNIICDLTNDCLELEIILTGIAVFERKK